MKKQPLAYRYEQAIYNKIYPMLAKKYPNDAALMWRIVKAASRYDGSVKMRQLPYAIDDSQLTLANLLGKIIYYANAHDFDIYTWHRNTAPKEWHSVCDRVWDYYDDYQADIVGVPRLLLDGVARATYAL